MTWRVTAGWLAVVQAVLREPASRVEPAVQHPSVLVQRPQRGRVRSVSALLSQPPLSQLLVRVMAVGCGKVGFCLGFGRRARPDDGSINRRSLFLGVRSISGCCFWSVV
eukprot:912584-Rhodomonas_salina.3